MLQDLKIRRLLAHSLSDRRCPHRRDMSRFAHATEVLEQRRLLSMVDLDPHFDIGRPLGNDVGKVRVVAQVQGGKILAAGNYMDSGKVLRFTASGALDDTFGVGGVATVPVRFHPNGAALQADGKIVLSGVDYNHGDAPFYVARLTPDGVMDTTFGGDGIVNLPALAHMIAWVGAADVADDGKIVIAANGPNLTLVRLTTAGALDTTFDGDGIAEIPETYATDVTVQSDGKIVIAGTGFRAARVTAAGALDPAFGTNGYVRGTGTFDGECVAIQSDGSIVVGASRSVQLGPIIRLMPNGVFDREFQDSTPDSYDEFVSDLVIDPATGKLLAVKAQAGSSDVAFIERFNTDGTLDLSFNEGEPLAATAGCLAVTGEGGFLIGPHRVYHDGGDSFDVKRYRVRPDVQLDSDGTLYLTGAGGDDTISVRINPSASDEVLVNRNGTISKFASPAVRRVNIMTAAGNDTFTSSLAAPVIAYAGMGDDSIGTGAAADTIYDGGGKDTVNSGGGNDWIESGAGNDQFYTGDGDDTVRLFDADSVNSGDGIDWVHTNAQEPITLLTPIAVDLGPGDDYLTVGYLVTRYVITGGDGNDRIATSDRADNIDAGAGNDTVSSSGGDDLVYGGSGDDLMQSWDGNDFVSGGDGNDTLVASNYHGGGSRQDVNTLVGGAGNDRIDGGDGVDLMVGNGGNDRLRGFSGADRLYGGTGVDRLDGGGGADRIYGDDGDDFLLEGGPGNDWVYGGLGDDCICGGSGDDQLYCGGGADTLIGNKGDDIFWAADSAGDLLDGGKGSDRGTMDEMIDGVTSIEQVLA